MKTPNFQFELTHQLKGNFGFRAGYYTRYVTAELVDNLLHSFKKTVLLLRRKPKPKLPLPSQAVHRIPLLFN